MAQCNTCGEYFKLKSFCNNTGECSDCKSFNFPKLLDEELEQDLNNLLNPSGKTIVKRYDEE